MTFSLNILLSNLPPVTENVFFSWFLFFIADKLAVLTTGRLTEVGEWDRYRPRATLFITIGVVLLQKFISPPGTSY